MLYNKLSSYLVLIFILAITLNCIGQQTDLDLNNEDRLAKINEYLSFANENHRTQIKEAQEAAKDAKKLSEGFDKAKFVESNLIIAKIYQQKGNFDTARIIINEALIQSKDIKNDTLIAEGYHSLGLTYQYEGSIDLAIESYHQALEINERIGKIKASLKQINNIGLLYREEEEYTLALEYLGKCLDISKEKGYEKFEFYSYGNIGYILAKQNKWEEALERFENTLELGYHFKDSIAYCTIIYLISDANLNLERYKEARIHANNALVIANNLDYVLGKVFSNRVLSEINFKEKNYRKARNLAYESLSHINENSNNLYLVDVLNVLYDIEYETGNFKDALDIQIRLSTKRDSLNQIKAKEKISNSEIKYQLLNNEKENEKLKFQNNSNKKNTLLATIAALLLLLLLLISFFAYRKSKNFNETLEKAINTRTKELEKSNIHLIQSNEELERFAYIASHDLKTPLRDIVSFTGLLERELKPIKNERVLEYLTFIKEGGLRLNNLIIDTLEFSRISYNYKNEVKSTVDLSAIIYELKKSMSNYIEDNNAQINIQNELPKIKAVNSSIILLFQNLIENSIKYNKSKTPIVNISIQEKPNSFSIFIEDNGIGIPKEYQKEIFIMFSRLHNPNEYEGSGLGLSICKKIVEKLNGKISIQSKLNHGSIFEINLPSDLIKKGVN